MSKQVSKAIKRIGKIVEDNPNVDMTYDNEDLAIVNELLLDIVAYNVLRLAQEEEWDRNGISPEIRKKQFDEFQDLFSTVIADTDDKLKMLYHDYANVTI